MKSEGQEPNLDQELIELENQHHSSSEHEAQHVDEKWLVSYADMMTLLFGLFVMMYAIAMETQGDPDKYFATVKMVQTQEPETKSEVVPVVKSQTTEEQGNVVVAKDTISLEEYNKVLAELEELKKKLAEMIENPSIDVTQYEAIKEELKNTKEELEELKLKMRFFGVNESIDPDILEKLKQELDKALEEIKKLKAQVKAQPKPSNEPMVKASELELKQQELEKALEQMRKMLAKIKQLEEELKNQRAIASAAEPPKEKPSVFLVLTLNWETEKHDLDLTVTDPNGAVFNFESREDKSKTGRFVIDSRTGPGVELWQSNKVKPGVYNISVTFYNAYGNNTPAKFNIVALTNIKEFKVGNGSLDFEKNKTRSFKIQIDDQGKVSVL